MNYRCKFCGYRFRDRDEQVCPECLTAREDDISCGVYGEEEHSHVVVDSNRGFNQTFAGRDTLRDGDADFLREERRTENRTAASHYERRNGGDINVAADGRSPYPNVQFNNPRPNGMPYAGGLYSQPVKKKNGCGTGCVVVIILFIILSIFGGMLADILEPDGDSEEGSKTVEVDSSSEEFYGVEAGEIMCIPVSITRHEEVEVSGTARQSLWVIIEGTDGLSPANGVELDTMDSYECCFEFRHAGSGKLVDHDDIKITAVICDAVDEDGGVITSYEGMIADRGIIFINGSCEIRPTLYADNTASELYIRVQAEYDGETLIFEIPHVV